MPVIYQAKCSTCGYQSAATRATDIAIRQDSGEIKKLGHPGEAQALDELSHTLKEATLEKRFVNVAYLICVGCGTIVEQYTVHPNQNYLLLLVVYVTLSLLCYYLLPFAPFINLGIALVLTLIFSAILRRYQKTQYKGIQALLPSITACPTCNEEHFDALEDLVGKKSVCPQCREKHLVYERVGIS